MITDKTLLAALVATLLAGAGPAPASAAADVTHIAAVAQRATLRVDGAGVLYDQNAAQTTSGAFVNEVLAPAPTVANTAGADDFTVPAGPGWTVTGFSFNAFGPGGNTPPAKLSLEVRADANGQPGATVVCSAPAATASYSAAPQFQVSAQFAAPCDLAPGHYWVSWSFDDADLAGASGFWGQIAAQNGSPALWRNSGDGFRTGCTAGWGVFSECGIFDASVHDFAFSVLGHENLTPSALEVNVTVAAYAGDPDACGTAATVEVNAGDQVNICYTLTNNGSQTLTHQSLIDSVDGRILAYDPTAIAPGQSHRYVRTVVAQGDTTRTATWTGYSAIASYAFDDSVTPDFIDISATGTDIGIPPGDIANNELRPVVADFPVRFYGRSSTALCVSNDGVISYDDAACTTPFPATKPDPGLSGNQDLPASFGLNLPTIIAPMWNDLDDGPGRVYAQTLGAAPSRRLVVQWNELKSSIAADTPVTFQVVFTENSDVIRFEYRNTVFGNDADNGNWATVGLQADPAGLYTKYSYRQPALRSNSAIRWTFTPEAPSSAESAAASISAGLPALSVAQTGVNALVAPGGTATRSFDVANAGNRDLHWSLGEAPGGSRAHFPRHERYVAPARTSLSAKPGTTAAAFPITGKSARKSAAAALGEFGVPTYGVSSLRPGLTRFDALAPLATYTPLGNSDDWIYAATFVGNDFGKLYVIVNDSWFYPPGSYGWLDTANGQFHLLGRLQGARSSTWSGMAEDPVTGTVYAVNYTDEIGSAAAELYSIDFSTGRAQRVGAIDGPGVHPVRYISGIAVSPAGLMYGIDLYGQSLIAIDKFSGAAAVIESFGLNVQYVQDLKFDPQTGDLYWAAVHIADGMPVGEMRVIDPQTAASQPIGAFPAAGEYPLDEMSAIAIAKPAIGCSAPGDVPWLDVGPTGGTIVAGAAPQPVSLSFDAAGLAPGLHQATICVHSDDPRRPTVAVPVALAVGQTTPLYDQNEPDVGEHVFNNTISVPAPAAGLSSEGADDFVVTQPWAVVGFRFSAFGNGPNPLPPTVNLRVLSDDGAGRPSGDAVCSATKVPAIEAGANQIGVFLPQACRLAPGTYWVAWSFADVNITTPVLGFWSATPQLHHQPAVWRNPGGALASDCTAWSVFSQCPSVFDTGLADFSFAVIGGADACSDVIFADGFDGSGACRAQRR
ncbi:lactonase family protein [Tahibacter caeni]|uniref:lactonase family protein n=1 Tax=Tahibacter caeni TaxID=1453545 RepID=UPI00214735FD|nr:lactonase family protein [Tahibacter caeni]